MSQKLRTLDDRPPVVAGRFYSSSANKLKEEIKEHFLSAEKLKTSELVDDEEILAVVSPHAGYVFSGTVSASAFLPLKNKKNIERIFLIGSSHHAWFDKASVYYSGKYETPLGKVKVDSEIAQSLLENTDLFTFMAEAHRAEHSLEVQLPFLQYILGDKFVIVPILLGAHSKETSRLLAQALEPYFKPGNLFVISTDLSHYPSYNDAMKVDKETIDALCSNNPDNFQLRLKKNEEKRISNLSTCMCGWTSALTLMYLTEHKQGVKYTPVLYQNSGDIPLYGEKERVVGYQSVLITMKKHKESMGFKLSAKGQEDLIQIARDTISEKLIMQKSQTISHKNVSEELKQSNGLFVSVYFKNELRGCIGKIESTEPLYKTVSEMAKSAAFYDTRFKAIEEDELADIHIEVSILSPLKKIESIEEIIPGKHGILIKKDFKSGTFLPQVAIKTGWNARELVEHCAKDKAGMYDSEWKDADLYTYEAFIFKE